MKYLVTFTVLYIVLGSVYFLQTSNLEFIIYAGVLGIIFGGMFAMQKRAQFPLWQLWLLTIWGLMHILGGAVQTSDGVLFAYRIYPFLDLGGEFYILKYDQVVHGYLYGVVALLAQHVLRHSMQVKAAGWLIGLAAVLISVGVSGLNEIMEFIISLTMENGVGGYDNTMLDMCFNLAGATVAVVLYALWKRHR